MNADYQRISSGAYWEDKVGYSRAVRCGNIIEVSGTVAVKNGTVYGPGDPYLQARRCLEIIVDAILQAGGNKSDIMRTRMYILNPEYWEEVGRAHAELLGEVKPATSMIVIKELISPEFLVEIEATARVPSQ